MQFEKLQLRYIGDCKAQLPTPPGLRLKQATNSACSDTRSYQPGPHCINIRLAGLTNTWPILRLALIANLNLGQGLSTGLANVGKYQFIPASRDYPRISGDETNQNYDSLVLGDVASPFVH